MITQKKFIILYLIYFFIFPYELIHAAGALPRSLSNNNSEVFIISPLDGEVVSNPVHIIFGVKNMTVSPAGIKKKLSGHHHLLIDAKTLPDLTKPIPSDKNHIHFGKGQKSTIINLESGAHTLQLLFADYLHIPHDKPLISKNITIMVE